MAIETLAPTPFFCHDWLRIVRRCATAVSPMPWDLRRPFAALRRGAACGLRALLLISIILFASQPTGALAAHQAMALQSAGAAVSDIRASTSQAGTAQAPESGCCQPADEQPACPDCSAVPCAGAPATLAAAATIRIFQRPLRHVFFYSARALSPHTPTPALEPPRA